LIVPLIGYLALFGIGTVIWNSVTGNLSDNGGDGYRLTAIIVMTVGYLLSFLASAYVQMAYLSGCLEIADGHSVTIGSFFTPRNFAPAVVAALLVGVLTAVGWSFFVIPGLIVGFLAQFTVPFVIDRAFSPITALAASFTTAKNNAGPALLSYLVQSAVLLVGALLFGVGLLVALPLAVLIQTYTYRRLSGGQVVPAQ
jgi:uncharacterized membrane protein